MQSCSNFFVIKIKNPGLNRVLLTLLNHENLNLSALATLSFSCKTQVSNNVLPEFENIFLFLESAFFTPPRAGCGGFECLC